jgi:hypothetical protein
MALYTLLYSITHHFIDDGRDAAMFQPADIDIAEIMEMLMPRPLYFLRDD